MRRPIWNAIERKLDDYSLRKKFYIFYVLCVMLPLIVTDAVVLSIVENAEKESSRHEMSSIASAVGYNLNSMVNNAEEAAKSIYTSKRIDDFISKEYTSSAEYVSEYQSFFQDTLFENTLGMSNIVFFLYADNPTIVNGGKVNDMSAVRNTDSYRLLEQKESGGLFFVYEKGVAGLSDERHMIYMKKLDFYSSDIEKVLKIEFNYGSMMRTFKNMNYDNEVLICHGDDIVLSNGAYSGVNKPFKTLEAIGKISDSVYRQKLSLYGCDLDIYVFKTRSNIWSMLMHNAPIIVFLMLINVFFPLCLFSIFNHSFTSRILQLSKVFKSVDSEKLVSMTDRESKDEIGSMIKNYNRMVSRTNDLIQTVYKNKIKEQEMLVSQKNAELLALHSQINPHFLFNALESIRMHSLLKKENETADMVEKLAIMQRQYVEWGNDAVTVAKECEFVKAYLALQKYRFGERLNYNIDIEADCMECQVPKLTLVTFVENACVHGIESKAAPGWIFVRIFKKAGFMHIEVEDTGSGIDPDALEKMKSNMKNADIDMLKTGGRVGVINACLRIKMVTESKAVFDVDSEEGCGTTVMIKIPETYL